MFVYGHECFVYMDVCAPSGYLEGPAECRREHLMEPGTELWSCARATSALNH